jgi:hypothetical protein
MPLHNGLITQNFYVSDSMLNLEFNMRKEKYGSWLGGEDECFILKKGVQE